MSFHLSAEPLNASALKAELIDAQAGACVIFEGWVRAQNEGQAVRSLEYEAYPELAEKEAARISAEARAKFPLLQAVAVHRVGHLQLGEMAVWVGVTATHRDAAFAGCRYLIDEMKARVPIWKKEYYVSGASQWINCATRSDPAEATVKPEERA